MKFDISELKVYIAYWLSIVTYMFSAITVDLVKDILYIVLTTATIVYTIYKSLESASKRKYYKRIEKEKKNESSNREI